MVFYEFLGDGGLLNEKFLRRLSLMYTVYKINKKKSHQYSERKNFATISIRRYLTISTQLLRLLHDFSVQHVDMVFFC